MKQMTPNDYYKLTPIQNNNSDGLIRTLIEYAASATGLIYKIPKLSICNSLSLNWVDNKQLAEAGISVKLYVNHSQNSSGDYAVHTYSVWYKDCPCALVHASGKYSDNITLLITDIKDFLTVCETYVDLAITPQDLGELESIKEIIEPDEVIKEGCFTSETLSLYYDTEPNIKHKLGDIVKIKTWPGTNQWCNESEMIVAEIKITNINPHEKLGRYYGKFVNAIRYEYSKTIGYRLAQTFTDADIVSE